MTPYLRLNVLCHELSLSCQVIGLQNSLGKPFHCGVPRVRWSKRRTVKTGGFLPVCNHGNNSHATLTVIPPLLFSEKSSLISCKIRRNKRTLGRANTAVPTTLPGSCQLQKETQSIFNIPNASGNFGGKIFNTYSVLLMDQKKFNTPKYNSY